VLAISDEYASGLIRATFTVAPRRVAVLAAKATAVGAVALVAGGLSALAAFATTQAILSEHHLDVSITDPTALRAILAAALYLVAVSLIGLSLGVLLRGTASAVAVLVVVLFLAPELLGGSATWMATVSDALPATAIRRLLSGTIWAGAPSVPHAVIVIAVYPVLLLVAAAITLRRRDA
jgi:ABC-2 type transport system permease protein